MFGFTQKETKVIVIESIINGIIWAICFYYIRKGLNKRNFNVDPEKKRKAFWYDAAFGGIAATSSFILKKIINFYLRPLY